MNLSPGGDKDMLLGTLGTIVGGVALLLALAWAAERAWFFSRAEATTGIVVASEKNPWSNSTRAGEYPIVEYTTVDNAVHRFEGYSSFPPRYHVGNTVNIYHVPDDPDSGRIDDFIELWLFPSIFSGLAILLLPAGLFLLWSARRRRALRTTSLA